MTAAHNFTGRSTKDVREQAEERISRVPPDVSGMSAEEIAQLLYELEVHQEELTLQNEELRRTQLEVEASHERYIDLYDFAPVGYLTLGADGTIIEANLTASTMLGQERSTIVGARLARYCDQGSRFELREHIKRVLSSDSKRSCELRFNSLNGVTIDVRLDSGRVADGPSDGWNCRVIMTDISERKLAESNQLASEERYRMLVEHAPFCIHEIELDGTVSSMNAAGSLMMGVSNESEVTGVKYLSSVCERDKSRVSKLLELARQGRLSHFDFETPEGQSCQSCFVPLTDSKGALLRIMGITEDITEQTRSQKALHESERLFRTIFEQAAIGVAQLDSVSGAILQFNRRYCEILGIPAERLVGTTWMDVTHPADLADNLANRERLLAGDIREFALEKRLQRPDGSLRWINVTVSPMWQPGEEPSTHIAIVEDITERRQAEELLRQRDQAFRTAITPIAFGDLEGRIIDANEAFARLFGFESTRQVIGQLNTSFHSEPISVAQINKRILERGKFNGEITSQRIDGTQIEIQVSATLFADADGRPIGTMATFMDVTPTATGRAGSS